VRFVIFCHSLLSDWNHGNAHFLRGVVADLIARGHRVRVFEPRDAWSLMNLVAEHGEGPIAAFARAYPELAPLVTRYDPATLDLDRALERADAVVVHEWNDHALVARIGAHRAGRGGYVLLFHDTHHRSVTDRDGIAAYDLRHYDGVLAFGDIIRDAYLQNGWARRAWAWHEAADARRFKPMPDARAEGDLVWIGNWGDEERSAELGEFLVEPVRRLGLRARVYGVRYPPEARRLLAGAGIEYGGWLPNFEAPGVFARFHMTVHVPRRPYLDALPGIPTIRPFEALACGIPLVSARWTATAGLFTPGEDFLCAADGAEMTRQLARLRDHASLRARVGGQGRRTVLARHTCTHRAGELLAIVTALQARQHRAPRAARGAA
jgi:spore maturation protein CgeB